MSKRRRSPKQTFGVLTVVLVLIVGFAAYSLRQPVSTAPLSGVAGDAKRCDLHLVRVR